MYPNTKAPQFGLPSEGEAIFCHVAEAAGIHYHLSKFVTIPTSMPPGFQFDPFMASLEKLIKIQPQTISFCHFGAITGAQDSMAALQDQKEFLPFYRAKIKELFEKYGTTREVVEGIVPILLERSIFTQGSSEIKKFILALVYGMLVDLGFKEP